VAGLHTSATVLIRATVVTLAIAGFVLAGRQQIHQESPAAPDIADRDHIRQESVQLMVTDRNGHAVTGLRAADFHILEDGVPQQIVSLTKGTEAGQGGAARMEGANAGPNVEGRTPTGTQTQPAAVRTYVICVDALSFAANSTRVRDALSKYFRSNKKSQGSLYKLVVLGREPVVVQEFTTDPQDVIEAVRGKQFQSVLHEGESTILKAETNKLKRLLDGFCGKCPCGPAAPSILGGACVTGRAELQAFVKGSAERTAPLTNGFLKQLWGVMKELSTMPAGPTLILISDGFSLTPGREFYGMLSASMPNDSGWKVIPAGAQPQVEPILKLAFARNIAIDTLDSRPVQATGEGGGGSGLADASSGGSLEPKRPANLSALAKYKTTSVGLPLATWHGLSARKTPRRWSSLRMRPAAFSFRVVTIWRMRSNELLRTSARIT
jgi:VWFA-related protein